MPSGMRGSLLLDRRPPHYRCPAVPGFVVRPGDPDGARILRSFLGDRLLWGWVLPCHPVRAPAADAFTEVLPADFTAVTTVTANCVYWYCIYRPAYGGPWCRGPPGAVAGPVALPPQPGFETRISAPSYAYFWPAVRPLPGLAVPLATRETITTPTSNVYSGKGRFPRVGPGGNDGRPGYLGGAWRVGCRAVLWAVGPAWAQGVQRCATHGHRRASECQTAADRRRPETMAS
jgi:hypothetical protein